MKYEKLSGVVLTLLAAVASVQPLEAACGAPFLITSINTEAGNYAYVVNPTVTPGDGGDGIEGSTITARLTGFFWGVGLGDPAPGIGADNGTFPALSWLYVYPNYPASVLTTWAADPSIDTCIDAMGPLGERCQATLFQDVDTDTGAGRFALVSTPDDPASGDFFLDNGGMDLTLAPMPQVTITGTFWTGDSSLELSLRGPSVADLEPGAYLSDEPACTGDGGSLNGLVRGWKLFYREVERGLPPPNDFDVSEWTDLNLGTQPLGAEVIIRPECSQPENAVYLAWQLVLDSGFEPPFLSSVSTRVECAHVIAFPDHIREAGRTRHAPPTRQR